MAESNDIVLHNPGKPDAFGYQVAFVKKSANTDSGGEEKSYSATAYVSELNTYESLFAKAMCVQLGVFDGGGLMETLALQPGDYIDVMLMKDEDSDKLTKRFVILNIGNVSRVPNSQAKTYTVSGITEPAFKNMKRNVYRGFSGRHSDMVTTICQDYLGIDEVETELTFGDVHVVSPGKTPFALISQLMLHSISEEGGETQSLYFFYEDRDGFKFKTLNKIIADSVIHPFTVSIDKNVDGAADLSKIQRFQQLKAGSQAERMNNGMYENEVVEINHLSRKVTSTLWKFAEAGRALQLLGPNPVVDEVNNLAQWANEAESKIRGLSNMVKFRTSDEAFGNTNNYGRKFGSMMAQKAMFNQIIYVIEVFGNPNIKAGDLIEITAPAMQMQSDTPSLDFSLQGLFLVGDVRHRLVGGEQYRTILNIFKDGYENEYKQESEK